MRRDRSAAAPKALEPNAHVRVTFERQDRERLREREEQAQRAPVGDTCARAARDQSFPPEEREDTCPLMMNTPLRTTRVRRSARKPRPSTHAPVGGVGTRAS